MTSWKPPYLLASPKVDPQTSTCSATWHGRNPAGNPRMDKPSKGTCSRVKDWTPGLWWFWAGKVVSPTNIMKWFRKPKENWLRKWKWFALSGKKWFLNFQTLVILCFFFPELPSRSPKTRSSRPIVTRQYPDTDADSKEEIEVLMQGDGMPGDTPYGPRGTGRFTQKMGHGSCEQIDIRWLYRCDQMCRMICFIVLYIERYHTHTHTNEKRQKKHHSVCPCLSFFITLPALHRARLQWRDYGIQLRSNSGCVWTYGVSWDTPQNHQWNMVEL